MQCEREISNFQAQPRAVFQRMRGKSVKRAVPTEIRVLIVRLRRHIGPRGPPEPLYRIMGLQAGLAPAALVNPAKRHPIRLTNAHPTHGSLPFPLSCPIEIGLTHALSPPAYPAAAGAGRLLPRQSQRAR